MQRIFKSSTVACSFLSVLTLITTTNVSASDKFASGPVKPGQSPYFCVALEDPSPAMSKGRAFYSAIFTGDGSMLNPVRAAYAEFLKEKYSYAQDPTTFDSSIQCVGTHSMEEAAATQQSRMKPGKERNPEGTIETKWSPGA